MKTIGEYLKIKLIENNLSQKQLAIRINGSPEYLSRVIKNKYIPSREYIEQIGSVLNFSVGNIEAETGVIFKKEKNKRKKEKDKMSNSNFLNNEILNKILNEVKELREEITALKTEKIIPQKGVSSIEYNASSP